MDKKYNSCFVPEQGIDVANYITEQLIRNFLDMVKKPKPSCPFWRKDIAQQDPFLTDLSKRYHLELIGVKELLKIFDQSVITSYIVKNKRIGFKMLKKENQAMFLYELFKEALKSEARPIIVENIPTISAKKDDIANYAKDNKGKLTL